MFFHLSSVFIYLIVTEEGNHLVQIGSIEEIAVLMDVYMYPRYMYSCTCHGRQKQYGWCGIRHTTSMERKQCHTTS